MARKRAVAAPAALGKAARKNTLAGAGQQTLSGLFPVATTVGEVAQPTHEASEVKDMQASTVGEVAQPAREASV
eukprot:7169785-Lingulodinium_polyedra.AAC.1